MELAYLDYLNTSGGINDSRRKLIGAEIIVWFQAGSHGRLGIIQVVTGRINSSFGASFGPRMGA